MMKIRNIFMFSTSLVLMSGVNSVIASTGADFGTTYTSTHHLGWSRQARCGLNCALKRAASNTVPASELSRLSVTHLAAPDIHLSPYIQLAPAGVPRQLASVCFITDTGSCSGNSFGGGGGEEYPSGGQPDWTLDNNKRCRDEGYALTSCSSVQQPFNRCPYNSDIFEKCVCKPSLVSCSAGQVGVGDACSGKYASCQCAPKLVSCNALQDGQGAACGGKFERCACKSSLKSCASPYIGIGSSCDGKYTECCNTCPEYTYTQASIPDGYVSGGTCQSCDGVKHKITPNPCAGFPTSCTCGYDTSSQSCKSGSATRYKSCKSCCGSEYKYDSSNCIYPKKLSGSSCGGKYTDCEGNCADAGYENSIPSGKICNSISYAGKTCYTSCRTNDIPETAKQYCPTSQLCYQEYRVNGEYLGVVVGNTIVSNSIPYNSRSQCINICQKSTRGGRSWYVPDKYKMDVLRCAVVAMGGKTDDVYWSTSLNTNDGYWLFSDERDIWTDPEHIKMYNDSSNYCACISDL